MTLQGRMFFQDRVKQDFPDHSDAFLFFRFGYSIHPIGKNIRRRKKPPSTLVKRAEGDFDLFEKQRTGAAVLYLPKGASVFFCRFRGGKKQKTVLPKGLRKGLFDHRTVHAQIDPAFAIL